MGRKGILRSPHPLPLLLLVRTLLAVLFPSRAFLETSATQDTGSPPASLAFIGHVTKHTTVQWPTLNQVTES